MVFKLADVGRKGTGDVVESAGLAPKINKQLGFADVMYTDPAARYLLAASVGGVGYHLLKNLLTPRKYKEYMRAKPLSSKFMELFKDIATGALISTPAAFAYPYLYGMFRGTSDLPPPDASRGDFSSYLSGDKNKKPIGAEVNKEIAENLKRIGHDYRFLESPDDERIWPSGFMNRAAVYVPAHIVANWNRISPVHRLMAVSAMRDIDNYESILSKYKALYGDDSPIVKSIAKQLAENTGDVGFVRRLSFYLGGPKPYEISSDVANAAIREMYDTARDLGAYELASKATPGTTPRAGVTMSELSERIKGMTDDDLKKLKSILNIGDDEWEEILRKAREGKLRDSDIAKTISSRGLPSQLEERAKVDVGRRSSEIPNLQNRFVKQPPVEEALGLENAASEFASKWPSPASKTLGKNIYSTSDFLASAATIANMSEDQIKALPNSEKAALLRSLFGGTGGARDGRHLFVDAIRRMRGEPSRGFIIGPIVDNAELFLTGNTYSAVMSGYGDMIANPSKVQPVQDSVMIRIKKIFDDPRIKAFLSDENAIRKFLEDSDVLGASKGSITRSGIISNISRDLSRIADDVSSQATVNKMEPLANMRAKLSQIGDTAADYIRSIQSANLDQESRLARIFPIFSQGSAAAATADPQIGKLFTFASQAGVDLNSYKFGFGDIAGDVSRSLAGIADVNQLLDSASGKIGEAISGAMEVTGSGISIRPKNRNAYVLAHGLNEVMSPQSDVFRMVMDHLGSKYALTRDDKIRDLIRHLNVVKTHVDNSNSKIFNLSNGELILDLPGAAGALAGARNSPADNFMSIIKNNDYVKLLDEAITHVYRNAGPMVANREALETYMASRNVVLSDVISGMLAETKNRLANMRAGDIAEAMEAIARGDKRRAAEILGPVDTGFLEKHVKDVTGAQPSVASDVRSAKIGKIIDALESANESKMMEVVEYIDRVSGGGITRSVADTSVSKMKDSDIARNLMNAIERILAEKGDKISSADRESMLVLRDVLKSHVSPSSAPPNSGKLASKIISAARKGQGLKQNLKLPITSTPITRHADDLVAAGRGGRMFGYLKKAPAFIAGADATMSVADLLMNLNDPNLHKYRLTSSTMKEIRGKGFEPTDPKVVMSIVLDSAGKATANKSSDYPLLPPIKKDDQYDINSINKFIDDLIKYVAANDATFFENIGYRVGGGDISSSADIARKAYNIAKSIEDGVPLLYSTEDGGRKTVTVRPEWISDVIKVMSERFPGVVRGGNSSISISDILGLQ